MALPDYSSSYSLFTCHMMLATSILTNFSKPLYSSLLYPHNVLHSPGIYFEQENECGRPGNFSYMHDIKGRKDFIECGCTVAPNSKKS